MNSGGARGQRRLVAIAALVFVVITSLVITVAAAVAEEGDATPIRDVDEGGFSYPEITSPAAPEEYPVRLNLGAGQSARQVNEHEVVVEYVEAGIVAFTINDPLAHDAEGATVPTAIKLSEGEVLTIIVRHRAGNPAAGGAPFVYPIVEGKGWEGGYFTGVVELNEPKAQTPPSGETPPAPIPCTVPSLRGLTLRAAKTHLRAAHCSIGRVRLAPGATATKGKVVKQSHAAGTELAGGAPVAVKLGQYRAPTARAQGPASS